MVSVRKSVGNLLELQLSEEDKQALADPLLSEGSEAQKRGENGIALKKYDAALFYWPHCTAALLNMGTIYLEEKKLAAAETCFRKTLAIDPECFLLHSYLGRALEALGRLHESAEHYRKAIELCDTDNAAYFFDLARVYEQLGDSKNAMEQCRLMNGCLDPADQKLRREMTSMLLRLGTEMLPTIPPKNVELSFNKKNRLIIFQP